MKKMRHAIIGNRAIPKRIGMIVSLGLALHRSAEPHPAIGTERTDFGDEPLQRSFAADISRAEGSDALLELSISSDKPLPDFYNTLLILDHNPGSIRMERLQSAGVGRDRHFGDQVCAVERAWLDANKLRVAVRFCTDERSQAIERDADAGTRKNVSVDATIHRAVLEEIRDDEVEIWRALDWEPKGFAWEPYPQDITVGVNRSAETPKKNIQRKKDTTMPDENKTNAPTESGLDFAELKRQMKAEAKEEIRNDIHVELSRGFADKTTKIMELADKYNQTELAREAIKENWGIEKFQAMLIERGASARTPVGQQSANADRVGCTREEAQQFSIMRAARLAFAGKPLDGIEREMCDEVSRNLGRDPQANGFFLPREVRDLAMPVESAMGAIARTMAAGDFLKGGSAVPTIKMDMIELLRNLAVVFAMGATRMDDIVGDLSFPRQTSGADVKDKSETGTSEETDQGTDDVKATPHRLTAFTAVTRQLMAQTSSDVEAWVREDLIIQAALQLDFNAMFGLGSGGASLGVYNTPGVGNVTFGASPTRAKIIEFETKVNVGNALMGSLGFVTSPAAAGKLKDTKVDAGSGKFLWDGSVVDGMLDAYKAMSTNQVAATGTYANRLLFGDWRQLMVIFWAGTEIIVDPYSAKKTGKVEIQIERMYDTIIRHPESFCTSTDSAAQ